MEELQARVQKLERTVQVLLNRIDALEGKSSPTKQPRASPRNSPAAKPRAAPTTSKVVRKIVRKSSGPRAGQGSPKKSPTQAPRLSRRASQDENRYFYLLSGKKIFVTRPEGYLEYKDPGSVRADLTLDYAYGYDANMCLGNLRVNAEGSLVYNLAALGIVQDAEGKQSLFRGHNEDITCLSVSENGKLAATGQRDVKGSATPYLCVWDAISCEQVTKIDVECNFLTATAFSPDGVYVILCAKDKAGHTGFVYEIEEKRGKKRSPVVTLPLGKAPITGMATNASSDGFTLAVWGDGVLDFFTIDPAAGSSSKISVSGGFSETGTSQKEYYFAQFVESGVVVGTEAGMLLFYNPDLSWNSYIPDLTSSPITCCAALPDGGFAVGAKDGLVAVFPAEFGSGPIATSEFAGKFSWRAMAYLEAEDSLVLGHVNARAYKVHVPELAATAKPVACLRGHNQEIWAMAMNPQGGTFVVAGQDKMLRLWDYTTKTCVWEKPLRIPAQSVAFNRGGTLIAVGGTQGYIDFHDATTGRPKYLPAPPIKLGEKKHEVKSIVFNPDDSRAIVACENKVLIMREKDESWAVVGRFKDHISAAITNMTITVDGQNVVTDGTDHTTKLWDVKTGQGCSVSADHLSWHNWQNRIGWAVEGIYSGDTSDGTDINSTCVTIDPTGWTDASQKGYVLAGDDFGQVNLFNFPCVGSDPPRKAYGGHSAHVTNVICSPDGKTILSCGGNDHAILQWTLQ